MAVEPQRRDAHLPRQVAIDAYGNGGFRFAGMSHQGSLLCLPSGLYGWEASSTQPFSGDRLLLALEEASELSFMLFGTGVDLRRLPAALADRFRKSGISCDAMSTGAAVRTYNIMLSEGRPVGAALVAVD
ncbi:hypothetical protein FPY71_09350 [Aureimonas fodinaquatilis]|uniref:Mth938-like domain-containing protein n=1 Tax=Aureimonas fodinaquatilis TaxID=2565783 RepID=A0A5B0DW77_9HYPH|nr:MTH938/NDUFAF3 family protein [Aureimonas fodinaquatilis]KAA0970683.1 hypothetical protein FPY71_09350 [Aureimonas fodinaquatilis]